VARIRTIKPEFFRHHELFLAERDSKFPLRVAFAGLWTAADREGRFRWIPENLKLDCLPYDKVDFSQVLDALMTRGFIEKYTLNGDEFGWIPGFSRHQVINNRERPSCIPSPTESETLTRAPREGNACPTPLCNYQVEGKGREGNKERNKILCDQVIAIWNQTKGVTQVKKIDITRTKHLTARLKDQDWPWQEALKKFPLRCFQSGDWIPNFDWFIKPGTVNGILEGKYDFSPSHHKETSQEEIARISREIEEEQNGQ
jgi:hypothetical protein